MNPRYTFAARQIDRDRPYRYCLNWNRKHWCLCGERQAGEGYQEFPLAQFPTLEEVILFFFDMGCLPITDCQENSDAPEGPSGQMRCRPKIRS